MNFEKKNRNNIYIPDKIRTRNRPDLSTRLQISPIYNLC